MAMMSLETPESQLFDWQLAKAGGALALAPGSPQHQIVSNPHKEGGVRVFG